MIIKKKGNIPVLEFKYQFCEAEWEADMSEANTIDTICGIEIVKMWCPCCKLSLCSGKPTGAFNPYRDSDS